MKEMTKERRVWWEENKRRLGNGLLWDERVGMFMMDGKGGKHWKNVNSQSWNGTENKEYGVNDEIRWNGVTQNSISKNDRKRLFGWR